MNPRGLRVLMCHNRYRIRGGEDVSAESEVRLLRNAGVEVDFCEVSNEAIADPPRLREGIGTVWSVKSYHEVLRRLRRGGHHVLHVQNFFPLLSPSVLWAARRAGVRVVVALRNFRLACLNGFLSREGRVCEDCLGRPPIPGLRRRCYRRSLAASSAVACMLAAHGLLRTWARVVDVFVTPSEFARKKLLETGVLVPGRVLVKPNFVSPDPGPGAHRGGYALFAGRLSREKGVPTMLDAWRSLPGGIPLKIVGNGPLSEQVAGAGRENPHIEWIGPASLERVSALMGDASMVVVPSEVYETFGRVVAEAYAVGTPVIASDLGALSELVEDHRTGLLFRAGDPEDLRSKVEWAWTHPREMGGMGLEARREYERKYTADRNLEILMGIYSKALGEGKAGFSTSSSPGGSQ